MVAGAVLPNGEGRHVHCEFSRNTPAQLRKHIDDTHRELRQAHCSWWSKATFPDYVAAMEAELDASHKRSLAALEEAIAKQADREATAGLTSVNEEIKEMEWVEVAQRAAIVLHSPSDAEEAKTKAEYIAKAVPFHWCAEEDFSDALLARACEVMS